MYEEKIMARREVDVICTHFRDGTILPNRIRVIDEDGQYQVFAIKECRDVSHNGTRLMPDGVYVTNDTLIFECIICVFGREQRIRLYNDPPNLQWTFTG